MPQLPDRRHGLQQRVVVESHLWFPLIPLFVE
jgi:hypothetical protein